MNDRPAVLDEKARREGLQKCAGWQEKSGGRAIGRDFRFRDFREAFSFLTFVALEAEKLDHHPDWSNSYNKVTISLTTHSAAGITHLDLTLAERINRGFRLFSGEQAEK